MTVRHFRRDDDLTAVEQASVLAHAARLKKDRHADQCLAGPQTVAIIFDKPTLRTQLSFNIGVAELGGYPLMIDGKLAQIGTRETIADTARVVDRQVSAVVWRTFAQANLEEWASMATVPVINALTDSFHPCQILADLLTISEHTGALRGRTLAYVGDAANNMAASYALGGTLAGLHVRIAGPASHLPSAEIITRAMELAAETGGSLHVTTDPEEAVAGAHAVATDTWVSMGMEEEKASRLGQGNPFARYQVNDHLMAQANPGAIFLHCLPAYRGLEVTDSVIEGPASVVWDEAENRLHVQKAVMSFLLRASRESTDREAVRAPGVGWSGEQGREQGVL